MIFYTFNSITDLKYAILGLLVGLLIANRIVNPEFEFFVRRVRFLRSQLHVALGRVRQLEAELEKSKSPTVRPITD
jgi:uncharacterized membrane protein